MQKEVIVLRDENRKIRGELAEHGAILNEMLQLLRDEKIAGEPRTPQPRNNRVDQRRTGEPSAPESRNNQSEKRDQIDEIQAPSGKQMRGDQTNQYYLYLMGRQM